MRRAFLSSLVAAFGLPTASARTLGLPTTAFVSPAILPSASSAVPRLFRAGSSPSASASAKPRALVVGRERRGGASSSSSSSSSFPPRSRSLARPSSPRNRAGRGRTSSLAASSPSSLVDDGPPDETCDVLVLGSGPAARSIASLLSAPLGPSSPLDVIVSDCNFDREWAPNYGVWRDEWDAILDLYRSYGRTLDGGKVGGCVDREWNVTDCYFGGSFEIPVEERFRIDRPYCRVDKNALRDALTPPEDGGGGGGYRVLRANHVSKAVGINVYAPPGSLLHDETGSTIRLRSRDGTETTVRTKLVVDCTGHETRLVLKDVRNDESPPAGFQIAFGALVEVDESSSSDSSRIGPYDKEAMTLFDYRTDHFDEGSDDLKRATDAPTFMYAMPLEGNRIFFEETSLVARPAVSFRDCKDRCFKRLEHLGIKVTDIEEEEFCYIPMGGPLPSPDQRVVGFGGAAAMVHPSTGYHLCRAMMGSGAVAKAVRAELGKEEGGEGDVDLDRAAANAYHAVWSPDNVMQRNFAVFGGEFLMKQNVEGLRGFFDGFFRLPIELWGGFLAGWPGLPNNVSHETWYARMWFGLLFISKLPLRVAADMALSIAKYSAFTSLSLPQSVTPFLGKPTGYEHGVRPAEVGDEAAKAEAREMIEASRVTEETPVAFTADGNLVAANADAKEAREGEEDKVLDSFQ